MAAKACVTGLLVCAAVAHADESMTDAPGAATAVATGASIGGAGASRITERHGFVSTAFGYDATLDDQLSSVAVELAFGRVAIDLRADGMDGETAPSGGVRVDVVRGAVDVSLAAGYQHASFNTVQSSFGRVGVAGTAGATRIGGSATIGIGLEENERYGELAAGTITRLRGDVFAAFEARFGIDLERDDDEPEAEPDWLLRIGPALAYTQGRYLASVSAGASAMRYRLRDDTHTGLFGLAAIGAVF